MSNNEEIKDEVIKSYILNSGGIKEIIGSGSIKEIKVVKKTRPQKVENSILFSSRTIIIVESGQQLGNSDEYSIDSNFTMQISNVNLITSYTAISCNKRVSMDYEDSTNKTSNNKKNTIDITDNFGLFRQKGELYLVHHMSTNQNIEIMKLPKGHNIFFDAIPNDKDHEWKKLDLGIIICDYNVGKEYKRALHSNK